MRRARRIAARIAVFALIGAAATVLVGCSVRGYKARLEWSERGVDVPSVRWPSEAPSDWPDPKHASRLVGWFHTDTMWSTDLLTPAPKFFGALESRYGWPCRALSEVKLVHPRGVAYAPSSKCLTWPGFAVDTAFWGGAAFVVWSVPGFVRRGVRRRRGRCVRCGYELAGGDVCPECGGAA